MGVHKRKLYLGPLIVQFDQAHKKMFREKTIVAYMELSRSLNTSLKMTRRTKKMSREN